VARAAELPPDIAEREGVIDDVFHLDAPLDLPEVVLWCQNRYGPNRCSSTKSDGSRTWVISVTHPTEIHGIGRTRYVMILSVYISPGRSDVTSTPIEGG